MSKKKKPKQTNGKGDKSRVSDTKKYAENWEKIFGKKKDKIINVYSSDDCRVDETGGPYQVKIKQYGKRYIRKQGNKKRG